MTVDELYVVCECNPIDSNDTTDTLVTSEVFTSYKKAKATIAKGENKVAITLRSWSKECNAAGYVDAYG